MMHNLVWNHVETISSTEDEALPYSSTIHTSQLDLNRLPMDEKANIRRSLSIPNNENILSKHEFEAIDDNDNEPGSIRDDPYGQQTIPKRRQSRATSSNNKVSCTRK